MDDKGENEWFFESAEDTSGVDDRESRLFWGALYITPAVWVLLSIGCLLQFSFKWLMVCIMALIMTSTNLVGYHKCQKGAAKFAPSCRFSAEPLPGVHRRQQEAQVGGAELRL